MSSLRNIQKRLIAHLIFPDSLLRSALSLSDSSALLHPQTNAIEHSSNSTAERRYAVESDHRLLNIFGGLTYDVPPWTELQLFFRPWERSTC